MKGLFLLLPLLAFSADIPLTITASSQQAILQYTAPSTSACTITVTDNSGIGVTVWDVSNAKFTNSNSDLSRADTISNGLSRIVVLGHRSNETGSDSLVYSRSLQAGAQHTATVTCGGDSGAATFTTSSIQQGLAFPALPPYSPTGLWNFGWPTVDYTITGKQVVYIDALTGAAVKRITGPGEATARLQSNQTFTTTLDLASAWTNPTNALSYGTASFAVTSTTNAKLFLPYGSASLFSNVFGGFGTNNNRASVDDLQFDVHGLSSDGATDLSACITINGTTCYSSTLTQTLPGSAGNLSFPTSSFPNVPWVSWGGQLPPRHLWSLPAVTANISGTAVTVTGVAYANGINLDVETPVGVKVLISGGSCTPGTYTMTVLTTLTATLGSSNTGTGCTLTPLNGGVLVWKSSGSGSVSINAQYTFAYSDMLYLDGSDGEAETCSRVSSTTTKNPDGTAAGRTLTGFACKLGGGTIYYFVTTDGSSRYLSNNFFTFIGSGPQARGSGNYPLSFQPFATTLATTWYTFVAGIGDTLPSTVFYQSIYSGDGSSNSFSYTPTSEPVNVTQTLFTALQPNDLAGKWATLIAATPGYKTTIWPSTLNSQMFQGFHPSGYAIFGTHAGQDSGAWMFPFNMSTLQFTGALDSFSTSGSRWGAWHTVKPTGPAGYAWLSDSPMRANCGTCAVQGPYRLPVDKVSRDGSTFDVTHTCIPDLTNSGGCTSSVYSYNCPSDTSSYWDSRGQNNCYLIHVTGEPCVANAQTTAAEIAAFPCAWDVTRASLQAAAVGDLTMDDTTNAGCRDCEQMQIIKKTINAANDIDLWVYRSVVLSTDTLTNSGCRGYPAGRGSGKCAHTDAWQPRMQSGPRAFDNVTAWYNLAAPTTWYQDNWTIFGGHNDPSAAVPSGTALVDLSNSTYQMRPNSVLPTDFGTLNNLQLSGGGPVFAGSTVGASGYGEIETYVSGKHVLASDTLKRWIGDWHTPQSSSGTIGESPQAVWTNTLTGPVSGTTVVYQITTPFGVDIKRSPLYASAGRWRLKDISGPASVIADSDTYTMCHALIAGECRGASSAGDIYINVPFLENESACMGNQMSINAPCVVSAQTMLASGILKDTQSPDPEGVKFIRLTNLFNPPFNSGHFEHIRLTPDGTWGFYATAWPAAYRNEIFAVKIPPIEDDSLRRDTWSYVSISLPAGLAARVRFGYDPSFRCSAQSDSSGTLISGRDEACLTDGTGAEPYLFAAETQHSTTCTSGCTINVPALSGRILYTRVERVDGSGTIVVVNDLKPLVVP